MLNNQLSSDCDDTTKLSSDCHDILPLVSRIRGCGAGGQVFNNQTFL